MTTYDRPQRIKDKDSQRSQRLDKHNQEETEARKPLVKDIVSLNTKVIQGTFDPNFSFQTLKDLKMNHFDRNLVIYRGMKNANATLFQNFHCNLSVTHRNNEKTHKNKSK